MQESQHTDEVGSVGENPFEYREPLADRRFGGGLPPLRRPASVVQHFVSLVFLLTSTCLILAAVFQTQISGMMQQAGEFMVLGIVMLGVGVALHRDDLRGMWGTLVFFGGVLVFGLLQWGWRQPGIYVLSGVGIAFSVWMIGNYRDRTVG